MIDLGTVEKLGLPWCKARGKEFGTYSVPGQDYKPYLGVTHPLVMRFEEGVEIDVPEFKIIEHPFPLVLTGSDVLRPAVLGPQWTYRCLGATQPEGDAPAEGFIEF